jgi:acetyl esterase/lipase
MMKQSLTYYLLLLVLKLKGVKKDFSQNPIDFRSIRKGDVRSPRPASFAPSKAATFKVSESTITEVKGANGSNGLILFVHGGAFVSGPTDLHWNTIKKIVAKTGQTVWLCDYPKAPENQIATISKNIDLVYEKALEEYTANKITLLGDSVGGTLITALMQRLIRQNQEPPRKLILVSPVMDSTMSNPKIEEVDARDPMLSRAGVLSAKKMCAGNLVLKDAIISPIYGSFNGFPKTILFLAENDISYPDQQLAVKKMEAEGVEVEVVLGKNMPHIWPLLPVMKEANVALTQLIEQLEN